MDWIVRTNSLMMLSSVPTRELIGPFSVPISWATTCSFGGSLETTSSLWALGIGFPLVRDERCGFTQGACVRATKNRAFAPVRSSADGGESRRQARQNLGPVMLWELDSTSAGFPKEFQSDIK